jgi:hypothetical protein
VAVRKKGKGDLGLVPIEKFIEQLKKEVRD